MLELGSLKYNYENDLEAKNFGEFALGTILYAKVAKKVGKNVPFDVRD